MIAFRGPAPDARYARCAGSVRKPNGLTVESKIRLVKPENFCFRSPGRDPESIRKSL